MLYIQVRLENKNSSMITWVEKKKNVRKGCYLTLKEDDKIEYKVTDIYSECELSLLHTDWTVGGLEKRPHK